MLARSQEWWEREREMQSVAWNKPSRILDPWNPSAGSNGILPR